METSVMQKETILLIEDDNILQEIIEDFLTESGYQVIKASDGLKGIELINNEKFDLIIVDVVLPFVSGLGVIKMARTKCLNVPIICITGYGYSPERMAEEEHADATFRKPFDFRELSKTIQKLLQNKNG